LFNHAVEKDFVMCPASILCQLRLTSDGICRINRLPEIMEALHVFGHNGLAFCMDREFFPRI